MMVKEWFQLKGVGWVVDWVSLGFDSASFGVVLGKLRNHVLVCCDH
jgi:hypothetical protein